VPVLLSSGYADPDQLRELEGAAGFLQKPFTQKELRAAVERAIGHPLSGKPGI
jgi:FixJ family two-component response regulator